MGVKQQVALEVTCDCDDCAHSDIGPLIGHYAGESWQPTPKDERKAVGMTSQWRNFDANKNYAKKSAKTGLCSEERSLMHPNYARNFICDFILGKEQAHSQPQLF